MYPRFFPSYFVVLLVIRKAHYAIAFVIFMRFGATVLQAQNTRQIEVINSDVLEIIKTPEAGTLRKLLGQVILRQDTAFLYCDSAYYFTERNFIEAFSKVKIQIGKDITISGNKLTYDGNTRIAELYDNITLTQKQNQLKTNRLTFYRNENYGEYKQGGILNDLENTLRSDIGYYYARPKVAHFYKNVVMKGRNFILQTDTLHYETQNRKALFIAPTYITTNDSQFIYTERGYYLTRQKEVFLYQNPSFRDGVYRMRADTIFYQDSLKKGWGACNVSVQKDTSLWVYGEKTWFDRKNKEVKITETPYLLYFFEKDTLVIFADTLYSRDDTLNRYRRLRAYPNARLTLQSAQAIADSIEYNIIDSTLKLMRKPALWSGEYQLTGDTITVFFKGNKADSLVIPSNSFGIQKEDSIFFNQVKGKTLAAKFKQNQIAYLALRGNCESIYTVKDGIKYIGLNKSLSRDLKIFFKENKPNKVVFIQKPKATFFPIYEVWKKNHLLPGFEWREAEKPRYYLGSKALEN
jgi:lipopolysaccharide export system protein LptA